MMQRLLRKWIRFWLVVISGLCLNNAFAQNPFPPQGFIYNDTLVPRIDLYLPADSFAIIVAPGNEESEAYFHATMIFSTPTSRDTTEDVGLQLRGNTSRYAAKKSFLVSLNEFVEDRTWHGVEKLNLNGEHNDPTISRSKICWDLLRDIGVPAPRSNHVELYINDEYRGLYANVEHIDEEFVQTRFGNNDGNLYKCLWPADLNYLGSDPDLYKLTTGDRRVYELKRHEELDDYSDLAHFIDVLNNTPIDDLPCELEKVLNVNSMLLSIAFDVLTGNWDGPHYNKNNFFLYHNEATGLFEYLPYDLDNTFGIDWFNVDWATRSMYTWSHPDELRPLYQRLLEVPEYRDRYSFYMQQIIRDVYKEGLLFPAINNRRDLIAPYVTNDIFYTMDYGFGLNEFMQGFEKTLNYNHTKKGIKSFITQRRSSCSHQLQINNIDPILSNPEHAINHLTRTIAVSGEVIDDGIITKMELCYSLDDNNNFVCLPMANDGVFPDQAEGDQRYSIVVELPDEIDSVRYYLRSVDDHQKESVLPRCGYRSVSVHFSDITIVVNEFMASNATTIQDDHGDYEDWAEIYNYGSVAIELGEYYISDKQDNPDKWQFPDISIQPGEYLLLWLDEEEDEGPLHADIKLSAGGEFIGIFDSEENNFGLIDGYAFGPQERDAATGRLPDGVGEFGLVLPTPGNPNLPITTSVEDRNESGIVLYPNPVEDGFHIKSEYSLEGAELTLYNTMGQIILEEKIGADHFVGVGEIVPGVYLVAIRKVNEVRLLEKVVK